MIPITRRGVLKGALSPAFLGLDARAFGATGDGVSDDTAAIQAAIDQANSDEKALYVPAGNYSISHRLFVPSEMRILGDGRRSRFLASASLPSGHPIFDVRGVNTVEISDIFVDLTPSSSAVRGIRIQDSSRVIIDNCWGKSDTFGAYTILCRNSADRLKITNNKIETAPLGIVLKPSIQRGAGTVTDFDISGNVIWGLAGSGGTGGISLDMDCERGVVERNLIRDMTEAAGRHGFSISVAGGAVAGNECRHISIVNNTCQNSRIQHIHVEGAAEMLNISGNVLVTCLRGITIVHGKGAESIVVSNNIVDRATMEGIVVTGAGMGITDYSVVGNIVKNCGGEGILVNGPTAGRVAFIGNIVKNNGEDGIEYNGGQDAIFSGNICTDDQRKKTQTYGISVRSNGRKSVIDSTNHLSGNSIGPVNNVNQASGDKRSRTAKFVTNVRADDLVFCAERDGRITEGRVVYVGDPSGATGARVGIGVPGNATKYASLTTATSGSQWDALALTLSANDFAAGDRIVVSNDGGGDKRVEFIVEIEYFEYN